jgi:hypothetical protein
VEWQYYLNRRLQSIAPPALCSLHHQETSEVMINSDAKELDHLLIIKVKKGDKCIHVKDLLNDECTEYQGPFELDSEVNHLIQYHNRVFPGKADKRTITPESKMSRQGLPVMSDLDKQRKSTMSAAIRQRTSAGDADPKA